MLSDPSLLLATPVVPATKSAHRPPPTYRNQRPNLASRAHCAPSASPAQPIHSMACPFVLQFLALGSPAGAGWLLRVREVLIGPGISDPVAMFAFRQNHAGEGGVFPLKYLVEDRFLLDSRSAIFVTLQSVLQILRETYC